MIKHISGWIILVILISLLSVFVPPTNSQAQISMPILNSSMGSSWGSNLSSSSPQARIEDSFDISHSLEEPFRNLESISLEGLDPVKEVIAPLESGVKDINAVKNLQ